MTEAGVNQPGAETRRQDAEVKQRVQQFYDRVGWQTVADGSYQNARYEDLRPVARGYIHRCHLRVKRFLKPTGRFLLDAGSGPVQYADYLTYSGGYQHRVCVDISIVALQEARLRIGDHGLFVVADVANLPFKADPFEGVVSLHTLHHLPLDEQAQAYAELYRVLQPGCRAVVVNGWTESPLMRRMAWLVRGMERLGALAQRLRGDRPAGAASSPGQNAVGEKTPSALKSPAEKDPTGTFINKLDPAWLAKNLRGKMEYEIFTWRSVNVRFLRAVIHEVTGGRLWLWLLFGLEERFPHYFGEKGQYPLIVIRK